MAKLGNTMRQEPVIRRCWFAGSLVRCKVCCWLVVPLTALISSLQYPDVFYLTRPSTARLGRRSQLFSVIFHFRLFVRSSPRGHAYDSPSDRCSIGLIGFVFIFYRHRIFRLEYWTDQFFLTLPRFSIDIHSVCWRQSYKAYYTFTSSILSCACET